VPNKLIKAINGKSWRERSAEIYPNYDGEGNMLLKAVALLGADTPSVKGLNDILALYTEEETQDVLEFENSGTFGCECIKCGHKMESDKHCNTFECPECGGTMRRADRPGAGQTITNEESETLRKEVVKLEEEITKIKKQLDSELDKNKIKEEDVKMTEAELKLKEQEIKDQEAKFEARQIELDKKDTDQKTKLAEFDAKQKADATAKFEADVDALILEFKESGKLLPSQEQGYRTLANSYGENKVIKFGEVGKEVDTPVLKVLRAMLEKNVKQVDFAETAEEGDGKGKKEVSKYDEFEALVAEYQKANEKATYAQAVIFVSGKKPELYAEYEKEVVALGDTSGKDHDTPLVTK